MIELTQDDDPHVQRGIRLLWVCALAMLSINLFIHFGLYEVSLAIVVGAMMVFWYATRLLRYSPVP